MIDKMLVSVFAWALAAILAMQLLLAGLPLFRRIEYDAVCHKYVLLMDRAGGLTDGEAAALLLELGERGFVVDQLSGTRDAAFGEELSLLVTAHYPGCRVGGTLTLEEVDICFTYQASLVCRRLKSYAEAP
jgi:hypothetical protein